MLCFFQQKWRAFRDSYLAPLVGQEQKIGFINVNIEVFVVSNSQLTPAVVITLEAEFLSLSAFRCADDDFTSITNNWRI